MDNQRTTYIPDVNEQQKNIAMKSMQNQYTKRETEAKQRERDFQDKFKRD